MTYLIPDWPVPAKVRSCITTRGGGASTGVYASNNFGLHVGDDPEVVVQNRMALRQQLGLVKEPQWLEQVHGVKVVAAKDDGLVRTADASYSNEPGQACLVMTADCLPVLLCNRRGTEVAALHCGWRSLAKGICGQVLKNFSSQPGDLMAYLGPAISQAHFEVGVDVLEAFFKAARTPRHAEQIAAAFISGERPLHFYADIYALARAELSALGVSAIHGGGLCTFAQAEDFFSYRRDGVTGRMASLIWLE